MDLNIDIAKNKLTDAVMKNDLSEVVQIIDGNNLDWGEIICHDELSPFHIALQENAIGICEFFIQRKLFLQNKNTECGLPLHRASLDDVPIDIFRSLLSVTSVDEDDTKELFIDTVRALQTEKLNIIIAFFSPIKCYTYHHGTNILHFFCDFVLSENHETLHSAGKCIDIPQILLAAGIPINAKDYHGNTYLHLVGNHCLHVVEFLVKSGVDVNSTNSYMQTPMHLVCVRPGNIGETVDILLKYGADINARNRYGCTPLLIAASSFNHQIKTLLSRNARTDISDHYRQNVFHSIALCDFGRTGEIVNVLESLLDASNNINNKDINLETPLHAVLANDGCLQIVHFLLKNGDDLVNVKDKVGTLPIHLAAGFEDTVLIEELLKAGADLRGTDKYGCNALHYAASLGNANGVKYLVSKGLHLQEKTNDGFTALDLAKMNQCQTVLDLIENYLENQQQNESEPKQNTQSDMFETSESNKIRLTSKTPFASDEYEYTNKNFELPLGDSKRRKNSLCDESISETMDVSDYTTGNPKDQQGSDSVSDELSELEDDNETSFSDSWVEGIPLTEIPAWIDEYRRNHSKSSCKQYGCKENAELSLELYKKTNESFESKLLIHEILQVLEKGLRVVEESNELFKVEIQLTGSAKEGSMAWGVSNDYDVLCILSDMAEFVEVVESEGYPPGFVKLRLKVDNPRAKVLTHFCHSNGYINSSRLAGTLHQYLFEAFLRNDILEGTGLSLSYPKTALISSMNLKWSGPISKFLRITIDLVPTIALKGWLPNGIREKSNIISGGMKRRSCMIVTKLPPQDNEEEVDHEFFRVSFSDVECQTLTDLPREIKLGYYMAKSMRYTNYLPYLMVNEDGGRFEAPMLLTSYMLKTALLHELEITNVHGSSYLRNAQRDITQESKQWAFRIYKRLLDFMVQKFMPSYFLPTSNVIASNFSHFGTDDATEHQIAYCNVLLAVLGQHSD